MRIGVLRSAVLVAASLACGSVSSAPAFDVAYRAWDIVTSVARYNHDRALSGACGRTFRPFVIPGLKRQTKEEEAVAATECVQAARRLCAHRNLPGAAEIAGKCKEFR